MSLESKAYGRRKIRKILESSVLFAVKPRCREVIYYICTLIELGISHFYNFPFE